MTQPRLCSRCGIQLPSNHPETAPCPRCLLEIGLEDDVVHTGAGPASRPIAIADLAPLFPQLQIEECIGQGGMGTVYRAKQKGLDQVISDLASV